MRVSHIRAAAAVIVLTALVCVVAAAGDQPIRKSQEPSLPSRSKSGVISAETPIAGQVAPEAQPPEALGLDPPGPPDRLWWLLTAIGAAALVWVAVRIVRELTRVDWRVTRLVGRRSPRPPRARTAPGESPAIEPVRVRHDETAIAREAVDAALVPLREPADPRAAVIEAYARLEHVLAERELGRQTAEAPREYLQRVMRDQGMPAESLTTLTALYEEARFSRHPIPESTRRRAATELKAARAALAVAPAKTVHPND